MKKMSDEVKKRVDEEFQTKNISDLITSIAVDYVQKVSEPLIKKEIDTKLTPRLIATENRLAALDEEIGKARGTRDDLRTRSEFAMTVIFAQNDNRKEFDQLKVWSEDPAFPFIDAFIIRIKETAGAGTGKNIKKSAGFCTVPNYHRYSCFCYHFCGIQFGYHAAG